MVKSTRNPRVWEAPQIKERKKRITKEEKLKEKLSVSAESLMEEKPILQSQENIFMKTIINRQQKQKSNRLEKKQIARKNQQRHKYSLIKDCLFNDIQIDLSSKELFDEERFHQKQVVQNFIDSELISKDDAQLLYIYGSPGIGKTYLIRNSLMKSNKWKQTVWINCFSIISKAKIEPYYSQQKIDQSSQEKIIVLDQFDQLQSWLNSKFFVDRFKAFLQSIDSRKGLKYILISNKSIGSFQQKPEIVLNSIINYSRIVQIPFLPYSLKTVNHIVNKKTSTLSNQSSELNFDSKLIAIAVNKMYSTTQDIRKVLSFILDNYDLLLVNLHDQGQQELLSRKRIIQQLTRSKVEKEQSDNLECNYLKLLHGRQKTLLKNIIVEYEQALKNGKLYLSRQAHKEGRKLGVSPQSVDLWLQEWMEMDLLTRKPYRPKDMFIFEQTYIIAMKLSMNRYQRYFY